MKRYGLLCAGFLTLMLAGCQGDVAVANSHTLYNKPTSPKEHLTKRRAKPDTVCIAAVGDIMLGSSYPDSSKLPPDSAKNSFKPVAKYLTGADVVFGNLEGTLLDSGMPDTTKKKQKTAYLFRMPTSYGQVLKDAGFNVLSIGNNHITDFGHKGCKSTTRV
jgi:poly-gamma-glutamate capsule biosynthesis protein CapA/YwtB (metallophosphatase superfamily)